MAYMRSGALKTDWNAAHAACESVAMPQLALILHTAGCWSDIVQAVNSKSPLPIADALRWTRGCAPPYHLVQESDHQTIPHCVTPCEFHALCVGIISELEQSPIHGATCSALNSPPSTPSMIMAPCPVIHIHIVHRNATGFHDGACPGHVRIDLGARASARPAYPRARLPRRAERRARAAPRPAGCYAV